MITATHVASSTGPCALPHAVAVSPYIVAEEGYCLVVRALESKEGYNQIEGADGVFRTIVEGDVLVGAIGERQALKGYSGRIPRQIVPNEDAQVADNLVDAIAIVDLRKIALPPFVAHIAHGRLLVESAARLRDGLFADVRAEDLNRMRSQRVAQKFM